ncbi:MAG: hypothetical protein QG617_571 [Campylobacterota bacterium]|nr:hypothetical protein [Campylobacterota bacterium]
MHHILITILLISSLYAKTTDFSIVINEPFNNALLGVTEDYDRSISAVGFVKTYKNNSSKPDAAYTNAFDYLSSLKNVQDTLIHLVKVDEAAEIKLRKSASMPNFSEAVGVAKTPQNGYFVGGHTLDGSMVVLKLDSNANTLSHKIFGTPNQDKMSKIVALRDGGILTIGTSATSKSNSLNLFNNGLGLNDIFLARFSSNAELLWSKRYGTSHDDIGVDAAEADDGSIILLSQTNSGKSKNIALMRVTQNGDKVWHEEYKSDRDATAYKIIKLKDNNFAISLSQKDEMNKEQIRLLKIDLQKNLLLDKTIHTTYASALKDIKESSEGKIVGVGYVHDNYNTDGLAMLLDSKFSMLSQEHYGSDEHDSFNALTVLHNSQIGVVGVYTNKNSQETNMWIVKLNRNLSMAQTSKAEAPKSKTSSNSANLYSELLKIFKDEIAANEITIKEDLSINLVDKNLYFKVAEYELTDKQKEFLQKFGTKLLPFLHKNRENIATLEISGHTSSEWGTTDFSQRYINNEELSMKRSFATLSHIFNNQNKESQKLLSEVIKGSGLSFAKKVVVNKNEDKEKSRRVSFKIILSN